MGVVLTVTITTQLRGAREHSCSVGTLSAGFKLDKERGEKVKLIESGN